MFELLNVLQSVPFSFLKQACKELFVFLCGVGGLDDDSMQINYECLSLIQIFLKQEEEGAL